MHFDLSRALDLHAGRPRNITSRIRLLFCAKNIERIGDHATNVAETVYYLVEGRTIPQTRPKGDDTVIAALSR